MDLMQIRRGLLTQMIQSGLGEYTKGYYAVLTPSSATEFVISHNLGIIPKVCIVEANFEPTEGVNVGLDGIYAFNVYGMDDNAIAAKITRYFYSNQVMTYGTGYTSIDFVTETELRLAPLFSQVRSPWNTNGLYTVRVLG